MPSLLKCSRRCTAASSIRTTTGSRAHRAGAIAPAARLDIYRNNFAGALTNALRLSYPAVQRLVGAEFFAGMAAQYIRRTRRAAPVLTITAAHSRISRGFLPAAGLAYLPGVARLEWAVNRARHALRRCSQCRGAGRDRSAGSRAGLLQAASGRRPGARRRAGRYDLARRTRPRRHRAGRNRSYGRSCLAADRAQRRQC